MARVKIAEGWEADVDGAVANLFESRLGPDISDDARRYCPVRTGAYGTRRRSPLRAR